MRIMLVSSEPIIFFSDDEMRKVSAAVKAMAEEKEAKALSQMEQN